MYPYIEIHLRIQSYWVMMLIAFLVAVVVSILEAKRKSLSIGKIILIALLINIFGWIGGRLGYYVLHNPKELFKNPIQVLIFWRGGLAAYGGIIIGFISAILWSKLFKIKFWKLADTFAPASALGVSIGRIGCFLNGCCYGKPTKVPWAIVYTNPDSVSPIMKPLHPTQLYELSGNFILFLFLCFMRKRYKRDGYLFLNFLIGYSLVRSLVAFYRASSIPIWGNYFYFTHLMSLGAILISGLTLVYLKRAK